MATWQADFELRPDDAPLPVGFRERLDGLLPRTRSWSPNLEMWGDEDGTRIDVWPEADGRGGEAMLRVDVREYDHAWAARAIETIRALGRDLWPVCSDGPTIVVRRRRRMSCVGSIAAVLVRLVRRLIVRPVGNALLAGRRL